MSQLIISLSITLLLPAFASSAEEPSKHYLFLTVDSFQVEGKTIGETVDLLLAKAQDIGAYRVGFRGIAIVDPVARAYRITMDLKAVPLGTLLGYIADVTHSVFVEGEGLCVLYPSSLPVPRLVSRVFEPSQNALRVLKLAQTKNPPETRARMESFGITPAEDGEIVYLASKNVLYAKLPPREMEVLVGLLTLLDRGLVVTPRSDVEVK